MASPPPASPQFLEWERMKFTGGQISSGHSWYNWWVLQTPPPLQPPQQPLPEQAWSLYVPRKLSRGSTVLWAAAPFASSGRRALCWCRCFEELGDSTAPRPPAILTSAPALSAFPKDSTPAAPSVSALSLPGRAWEGVSGAQWSECHVNATPAARIPRVHQLSQLHRGPTTVGWTLIPMRRGSTET